MSFFGSAICRSRVMSPVGLGLQHMQISVSQNQYKRSIVGRDIWLPGSRIVQTSVLTRKVRERNRERQDRWWAVKRFQVRERKWERDKTSGEQLKDSKMNGQKFDMGHSHSSSDNSGLDCQHKDYNGLMLFAWGFFFLIFLYVFADQRSRKIN